MGCLVDKANSKSGLCYPSEEYIAGWTGRPLRTVQRAIRTLWEKRLINIIRRSATSNRYFVQWMPVFSAYWHQEAFEKRHAQRHAQKVAGEDAKSGGSPIQKVAAEPRKIEPRKMNLGHEMAHSPAANDAYDDFIEYQFGGVTQLLSEFCWEAQGFSGRVCFRLPALITT